MPPFLKHNSQMDAASIAIILPVSIRQDYSPIIQAYQESNKVTTIYRYTDRSQLPELLLHAGKKSDAILLTAKSTCSPSTILSSPFVQSGTKMVPIGYFPLKSNETIKNFAQTVRAVHSRKGATTTLAILAQRFQRFLSVASRVASTLKEKNQIVTYRWTGEVVLRDDMFRGLATGLGVALYLGHGRPEGWAGYYGTRIHDLLECKKRPLGILISLCCLTAKRYSGKVSFSESVVLNGFAAASFGAVKKTLHLDNTRWAIGLCESLKIKNLHAGALLAEACPVSSASIMHYRIIGDPLAPLICSKDTVTRANKIPVYH